MQQRTTMYANDGKTVIATLFDQNRQAGGAVADPEAVTQRADLHRGPAGSTSTTAWTCAAWSGAALKTTNGDTAGASTLTEQYVKQVRDDQATTDAERAAAYRPEHRPQDPRRPSAR